MTRSTLFATASCLTLLCINVGFAQAAGSPSAVIDVAAEAAANAAARAAPVAAPVADRTTPAVTEVIVTAPFSRSRMDVVSGISVIQGSKLTLALRPTLGETLNQTPGVSATSFGPNASRPVLRGLQGERVRLLTEGIGSFDVSNTSADHAVAINPLLAERIEVLRGPATLQFGSSAIGGVVNVIDKRIPRSVPTRPLDMAALVTLGSAAEEVSLGARLTMPLGNRFVLHGDASTVTTGDLAIGSFALSRDARAVALANAGQETDDQIGEGISFANSAGIKGHLPNSAAETTTYALGFAYVTDPVKLGMSVSRYENLYGIPLRYAIRPGEEQEGPRLSVTQDRLDLRAEFALDNGFVQSVTFRSGLAQYEHVELDDAGNVGTAFSSDGLEGRLEIVQAARGGWKGAAGVQFFSRDFDVVGDEAFLPANKTTQLGLFTLQTLDLGQLKLEGGARYEHSVLKGNPRPDQSQFFEGKKTFDALSVAAGTSYEINPASRLGVSLSHSVRAPSAEELFSNGPHAGTQAFEVGNPEFKTESAWGLETVFRTKGTGFSFEASVFYNDFDNFIYETANGEVEDGLPVFQFRQSKARQSGIELQGSKTLARLGKQTLIVEGLLDYTRVSIASAGPAPRIPPLRVSGALVLEADRYDLRAEIERTDAQKRLAAFETPSDSYTLVNLALDWRPWGDQRPVQLALSANNIFDVDARRHASVLKDFAPLAGRDIRVTLRSDF